MSDLEKDLTKDFEEIRNKKEGTRSINLDKDEVVKFLSGNNELAQKKLDELPKTVREELKDFFEDNFWQNREATNG
ncbi:MAG: hypothetical protein WC635_17505 [Bacteriovorax sp.]